MDDDIGKGFAGQVALLALAVVIAGGCGELARPSGVSRAAGLVDFVDASYDGNLSAHQALLMGNVSQAMSGDFVGGHDLRRMAHVVKGKGSSISYTVAIVPGEKTTLEIEEIDGREGGVRGY